MTKSISLFRPVAAAVLLALAGAAHATTQFYTSEQGFLNAVDRPATDDFSDLASQVGQDVGTPVVRNVGDFSYSFYAYDPVNGYPDTVFIGGNSGSPVVSPSAEWDILILDNIGGNPNAFGAYLYGSDENGNFVAGTSVTLEIADSLGNDVAETVTPTSATDGSFLGFVTSGTIETINIYLGGVASSSNIPWPTINNVTFSTATISAVPEPTSYALLLAGLGLVGAAAARRRRG